MSLDTYNQLKQQIARLEKQAEKAKKAATKDVVQQITELMATHDVTLSDIRAALPSAKRGRPGRKAAAPTAKSKGRKTRSAKPKPKFRSPENRKDTWSGRGRMPKWARDWVESGKPIEDLAI